MSSVSVSSFLNDASGLAAESIWRRRRRRRQQQTSLTTHNIYATKIPKWSKTVLRVKSIYFVGVIFVVVWWLFSFFLTHQQNTFLLLVCCCCWLAVFIPLPYYYYYCYDFGLELIWIIFCKSRIIIINGKNPEIYIGSSRKKVIIWNESTDTETSVSLCKVRMSATAAAAAQNLNSIFANAIYGIRDDKSN